MITQDTIAKIIDAADVVDVVGDFVKLTKRGSNYLGCCPFHDEKTPSFTVSGQKGLYKCFGCGAAGNSVKFVMEHNQMNYPEALRYLAEKYRIEVEETVQSSEEIKKREENESLQIVNNFANDHFKNNLYHTDEGQTIGMAYFKERGLRENTIEKFELGYCIDDAKHFTNLALDKQYEIDYLKTLGLTTKNGYDFYRGRVIFPIHSVNGKVIGFGARTLKNDKKTAKYFNSPENPIYHKSRVLYGLFQAKKMISKEDECFLVEGYTDVISLSQAGIENVVASSGTSLTEGQIKLIKRFTPNITVLYDGDAAGIKAAFRGIDLILEQDMNVKVALLPDGEDPDSFVQAKGAEGFKQFIKEEKKDFIPFKAGLLLKEAENDPIKKTEVIRDIVTSITKIPDAIKRSLYTKDSATLLDIEERILINEINKMISGKMAKQGPPPSSISSRPSPSGPQHLSPEEQDLINQANFIPPEFQQAPVSKSVVEDYAAEKDVIRALIEFGTYIIDEEENTTVAEYTLSELEDIEFEKPIHQKIIDLYRKRMKKMQIPTLEELGQSEDEEIQQAVIDLTMSQHSPSDNWYDLHEIVIVTREEKYETDIYKSIATLQLKRIDKMMKENQNKMKTAEGEALNECLEAHMSYMKHKKHISDFLGSVIR